MTVTELQRHAGGAETAFPHLALSLVDFVIEASRFDREWIDDGAGVEYGTIDWKAGWQLVRQLKRRPELQDLPAARALKKIRPAVTAALTKEPHIFDHMADEFEAVFLRAWKAIRTLPGEAPLDSAHRLATQYPLRPAGDSNEIPSYCRLLSLAGWLQYLRGEQVIFLPQRQIGELIGCSQRSVSSYISLAIEEGFLRRVRTYPRTSRGGRADEYRFAVERWKILTEGFSK